MADTYITLKLSKKKKMLYLSTKQQFKLQFFSFMLKTKMNIFSIFPDFSLA